MRRLISILAAMLLAAGTLFTAAGAASAGAAAAPRAKCNPKPGFHFNVSKNGVNFYLGAPRTPTVGAAAFLKPTKNSSTTWNLCAVPGQTQINNGGLSLTSRSSSVGQLVTLTPTGNNGNGFISQEWVFNFFTCTVNTCVTFQNVKTHLFLRVRNSGPIMGQTVTTGLTPTNWIVSF